jgi:uncharacterized membrane protein YjgN (DUF898 family)
MHAYQEDSQPAQEQRIRFHATGGEYFRIWIVNLLLTVLTLGIYSAWAKVRRNQYFYSSTELAGASFEYHGNPSAILKGRLIGVVLVGAYTLAGHFAPLLGGVIALALGAASPWFILKSMQFRLHNTSYRGIRFRFAGDVHDAYKTYLIRPMLSGVTLGLAIPFVAQRIRAWLHNESRFGSARFSFDASVGSFYKLYAVCAAVMLGGVGLLAWAIFSGGAAADGAPGAAATRAAETGFMIMGVYAWLFLVYPLFASFLQNLVWSHTSLEGHQFRSDMKLGRLVFITVTNYLAVICTLGLFLPFAKVRAMRYRLESISLQPQGSLDDFVAASSPQVGAMGEGVADIMDFDIAV